VQVQPTVVEDRQGTKGATGEEKIFFSDSLSHKKKQAWRNTGKINSGYLQTYLPRENPTPALVMRF